MLSALLPPVVPRFGWRTNDASAGALQARRPTGFVQARRTADRVHLLRTARLHHGVALGPFSISAAGIEQERAKKSCRRSQCHSAVSLAQRCTHRLPGLVQDEHGMEAFCRQPVRLARGVQCWHRVPDAVDTVGNPARLCLP